MDCLVISWLRKNFYRVPFSFSYTFDNFVSEDYTVATGFIRNEKLFTILKILIFHLHLASTQFFF